MYVQLALQKYENYPDKSIRLLFIVTGIYFYRGKRDDNGKFILMKKVKSEK